jgi:hypothetical protein
MSKSRSAWSRRVSLAERSRSSLALYLFMCRFLLLFLPVMPMTTISGNSRFLRTGFCTGARRRRRVAEGGLHL